MSRNLYDLVGDISGILDEVECEYTSVMEERDDLREKLKNVKEKYEDLKQEESESQKAYDLGFEDGEQSMQEKANKIIEFYRNNNNDIDVLQRVFSRDVIFGDQILEDIETAYNKIAEYEKKEKEIKVGDEVVDCDGTKYVVRFLNDSYVDALAYNGVSVECDYADISKTGKHYPLEEMLKELK
jgi:cell division septum initiation protein DivIVA